VVSLVEDAVVLDPSLLVMVTTSMLVETTGVGIELDELPSGVGVGVGEGEEDVVGGVVAPALDELEEGVVWAGVDEGVELGVSDVTGVDDDELDEDVDEDDEELLEDGGVVALGDAELPVEEPPTRSPSCLRATDLTAKRLPSSQEAWATRSTDTTTTRRRTRLEEYIVDDVLWYFGVKKRYGTE